MAGRSTKKKRSRKKKSASGSLGRIAVVLAVAAVVILAAMKYIDTPRGKISLLDLGLDRYYAEAQSHIGELIRKGAPKGGLPAGEIRFSTGEEEEQPETVVVVKGDLPSGRSLMQLNIEIDRAVRSGGGRVRSCVEKRGGRDIEMEIGTKRAVTHRCEFRMSRRAAPDERPSGPAIAIIIDELG